MALNPALAIRRVLFVLACEDYRRAATVSRRRSLFLGMRKGIRR